tara:strand:- start:4625 stop:5053 length:429 start_codon:yes stop_codon:yes gene_type:complete
MAGNALAECLAAEEVKSEFPRSDIFNGKFIVTLPRIENGLMLEAVRLEVITRDGVVNSHSLHVPHWVEPLEGEEFHLSDGIQTAELTASYSDGCESVLYRQDYRPALAENRLMRFMIHWAGEGYLTMFACFSSSQNNVTEIE